MSIALHPSDPSVMAIVKATFPAFVGKRIAAVPAESFTAWGTNWDEGYRRQYAAINNTTMQAISVPKDPNWTMGSESHRTPIFIPDGCAVVVLIDSRCKQHIEIIAHPGIINPMLPPPSDLTFDEQVVLYFTRCLKSSYGGVSNYRFVEGGRRVGLTLGRWEAAKETLKGKGFLNKAGAITVDGRNASPENEPRRELATCQ